MAQTGSLMWGETEIQDLRAELTLLQAAVSIEAMKALAVPDHTDAEPVVKEFRRKPGSSVTDQG